MIVTLRFAINLCIVLAIAAGAMAKLVHQDQRDMTNEFNAVMKSGLNVEEDVTAGRETQTCFRRGQLCVYNTECCGDLECYESRVSPTRSRFTCEPPTIQGTIQCQFENQFCNRANARCCNRFQCDLSRQQCVLNILTGCIVEGESCDINGLPCCETDGRFPLGCQQQRCVRQGAPCTSQLGGFCSASQPCCNELFCSGGQCVNSNGKEDCGRSGAYCQSIGDCCGNHRCRQNQCIEDN